MSLDNKRVQNNKSIKDKIEGTTSGFLLFYVFLIAFSAFFILVTVIMNRMGMSNAYLQYVSVVMFGCIFFIPIFIFLCLHVIRTLYLTFKEYLFVIYCKINSISYKKKPRGSAAYYIMAVSFGLVLGVGAKLSAEALVNTVQDYSYRQSPHEISLDVLAIRNKRSKNLSFTRKDYTLIGVDEYGVIHEFKLIDVPKIKNKYEKASVKYLPHTKMVIEYELH